MQRRLRQTEADFLHHYFGDELDTAAVRVAVTRGSRAYSIRGDQIRLPRHCFVNVDGTASVNLSNPYAAATFAHEATHVWQRQRGLWVTLRGALLQLGDQCGIDPYAYDRTECNPLKLLSLFLSGNVERQGQIVQDLVFSERTGQPTLQFEEIRMYLLSCQRNG
jgi:hypothetical protein